MNNTNDRGVAKSQDSKVHLRRLVFVNPNGVLEVLARVKHIWRFFSWEKVSQIQKNFRRPFRLLQLTHIHRVMWGTYSTFTRIFHTKPVDCSPPPRKCPWQPGSSYTSPCRRSQRGKLNGNLGFRKSTISSLQDLTRSFMMSSKVFHARTKELSTN